MLTRHFLKVLLIFTTLIAFGLLGVFLVTFFDKESKSDQQEGRVTVPEDRVLAE